VSWRRALPALLLGLALVLAPAGTASAAPILDSADATELASTLAEASQAQGGICYGWQVEVTDPEGADGNEVGSSAGAGKAVDTVLCRSYVVLSALVTYTSELSESEDSASWRLQTSFAELSSGDLDRFGNPDDLLGDNDDARLFDTVKALPLLVSDKGLAPPIQLDASTEPVPEAAGLTGTPGNDRLRAHAAVIVLLVILVIAAVVTFIVLLFIRPRREQRRPPPGRPQQAQGPPRQPPYGTQPRGQTWRR
jgi:hypothetical protein